MPLDRLRRMASTGPVFATSRLIPAAKLIFIDAPPITVLPVSRAGWGNLCRILSIGRLCAKKGNCDLQLKDLLDRCGDLHLLLWPQGPHWQKAARHLMQKVPGALHILLSPQYDGGDAQRFDRVSAAAATLDLPTLASAAPRMHRGGRRRLADIVTAIRTGTKVDDLGRAALANSEQRLRSGAEATYVLRAPRRRRGQSRFGITPEFFAG